MGEPARDSSRNASSPHASGGSYVADPNRGLFESVVRLLAPVLDELVFVGGYTTDAASQARRTILEQRLEALARSATS
jgi:hypothetical protein